MRGFFVFLEGFNGEREKKGVIHFQAAAHISDEFPLSFFPQKEREKNKTLGREEVSGIDGGMIAPRSDGHDGRTNIPGREEASLS